MTTEANDRCSCTPCSGNDCQCGCQAKQNAAPMNAVEASCKCAAGCGCGCNAAGQGCRCQ